MTGSRNVANIRLGLEGRHCVLVSSPLPVLGDSPEVITLVPGAPVRIEKLSGAMDLARRSRTATLDIAAVSTGTRRHGIRRRHARNRPTSASHLPPGGYESRCAILRTRAGWSICARTIRSSTCWICTSRTRTAGRSTRPAIANRSARATSQHRDFLFPLTLPANSRTHLLPALRLAGTGGHQPVAARSQRARRRVEPRTARLWRVFRLRDHAAGVERPGVPRGARWRVSRVLRVRGDLRPVHDASTPASRSSTCGPTARAGPTPRSSSC